MIFDACDCQSKPYHQLHNVALHSSRSGDRAIPPLCGGSYYPMLNRGG